MADNQKYYYMKLKEDFFEGDSIILLESMENGIIYSNILLKLYCRSLRNGGRLAYNDRIPYNSKLLAQITRVNIDIIEKALQVFKELDLIEILDNGAIYMLDIQNYIGHGSTEAERKAEYRRKIKEEQLLLESGTMSETKSGTISTITTTIVRDKDITTTTKTQKDKVRDNVPSKKVVVGSSKSITPERFYKDNFGMITPIIADKINSYVEDGIETVLIVKAMEEAKLDGKTFKYACGILNNCLNDGILTLEQFNSKQIEYKNSKPKAKNTKQLPGKNYSEYERVD